MRDWLGYLGVVVVIAGFALGREVMGLGGLWFLVEWRKTTALAASPAKTSSPPTDP